MFEKMARYIVAAAKAHRWLKPFAVVVLILLYGATAPVQWTAAQLKAALVRRAEGQAAFRPSHGRAVRAAAAVLTVCMMFTIMPSPVFAAEAETGLCPHHPAHTTACGYAEAEPGAPCAHQHTGECYTDELVCGLEEVAAETASGGGAGHAHTQGCYALDCPHARGEHDVNCGYSAGAKGQACGNICESCAAKQAEDSGAGTGSENEKPAPEEPKPEPTQPVEPQPDPVQPGAAQGVTITAFDALEEAVRYQSVPAGTGLEGLNLPATLGAYGAAAAPNTQPTPQPVTVKGVVWTPDTPYEGAAGVYTFTASAAGYTCAAGAGWPAIAVTVEEPRPDEIDALCAAIDALPAVEEIYQNAPGNADEAFAAWLAETRALLANVPALWGRLLALAEDAAAMGRITEARAGKLAGLNDLAGRIGEMETLQTPSIADFSALASAIASASSEDPGNPTVIAVTGNITLTGMLTPPAGKYVKLTSGSNGPYTLTMASSFSDDRGFFVTGGSTLILENILLDGNQTTKPIVGVRSGDLVIDQGAILQNSKACAVQIMVDNGADAKPTTSVVMNDGEIRNNAGGGIDMNITYMFGNIQQALSLTVNGGKITGNGTEGQRCGGVYARDMVDKATVQVTIAGGEISGNKAKVGGGIFVDCPFEMTAGTITGNTASTRGGGIYINENQQPSITGGTISGNTAAGDPSYPEKGQGKNVCTRSNLALGGSVNIPDGLLLYGGASTSPDEAVLLLSQGLTNAVGIESSYRINPQPMVNMPVARMADGSAMPQAVFEKLLLKGMDQFSLVLDENGIARLGNAASGQPLVFYSTYGGTSPVFEGIAPSQSGTGWSWDKSTKTLTLSGARVTTSDAYALSLPPDAKIVLAEGTTSSFTKTGNYYTVFGFGALEITGQGKLIVNGEITGISAEGPITLNGCEVETTGRANGGIYGYADVTVTGCRLTATGGIVVENNGKLKISETDATIDGSPYAAVMVMVPQGADLADYLQLTDMPNGTTLRQGQDGTVYYATVANAAGEEATVLSLTQTIPTPTVDTSTESIYANGAPLLLVEGADKSGGIVRTVIYLDKNGNGQLDGGFDTIFNPDGDGPMDGTTAGNDLSGWGIYGGSKDANVDGNTKITMSGGMVQSIYGGGRTSHSNARANVTGSANVKMSGGHAYEIFAGGAAWEEHSAANVAGDTNLEITGGTIEYWVHGGGFATNTQSVAVVGKRSKVLISGDAVIEGWVFGGGYINNYDSRTNTVNCNVNGAATVNISGNAKVKKSIFQSGHFYGLHDDDFTDVWDTNDNSATVGAGSGVTIGGSAKIGGASTGIVINGGSPTEVKTGVASFAIDGGLTENASVNVKLPAGYEAAQTPTIATGAVQADLAKIKLVGGGAEGKQAYYFNGKINVMLYAPKVDTMVKHIYANGVPLLLVEGADKLGGITRTVVYIDKDGSGAVSPGDDIFDPDGGGPMDGTTAGNDLSGWGIYGGSTGIPITGDTKITMAGGYVGSLYGGSRGATVNGNAAVIISGGTVQFQIYGGGSNGDQVSVSGSASVTFTGGTVKGSLCGGASSGTVGSASVTVGGSASFSGSGNIILSSDMTSFAIAPHLTGEAGCIKVELNLTLEDITALSNAVIATGASASDLEKLSLISNHDEGLVLYLDGTDVKVKQSSDATLASLSYQVNGGSSVSVPGFAADTAAYNVSLPFGTSPTAAVTLNGTPNQSDAQVIENSGVTLTGGAGVANIKVRAADGTTKNYAVNFAVAAHNHCICGGDVNAGGHTAHTPVSWTAWSKANSLPYQSGNYCLTTDVTGCLYIPAGAQINLCLNGHKLTADAGFSAVILEHGAALNLCDCNSTDGSHTAENPATGESVTVTGGLITGGTANSLAGGGVDCKGDFNMYGGTIAGNNCTSNGGGGVFVYAGGVFHMYGGAIRANQAAYWGGGVNVYTADIYTPLDKGRFYLHAGAIYENHALRGGGVGNEGMFYMDGGKITGNTATAEGGGLWATSFELAGGEITANHAQPENGCGVYMDGYGDFILRGNPVITGNTAGNSNAARNLYFQNGQSVAIGAQGLAGGAKIGVSTSIPLVYPIPIPLTGTNSADHAAYFISDDDARLTENSENNVVQLRIKSSDAQLSALSYKAGDGQAADVPQFASNVDTYNVALPYDTSPAAAITLNGTVNQKGASVTQNNGVTLTGGRGTATITVTAENGTAAKTYTVNFTIAPDTRSTEKQITAFTIENQVGQTVIDQNMHTITVTMPGGTDAASLAPAITVSYKAAVSPQSGAAQNFTGSVTYTVKAENGTTQDYTVMVRVQPAVATSSLPGGAVGVAYSQTLSATGTAPMTWGIESGQLPDGLTMDSDGVISGVPAAPGGFTFTVKAANSAGSATRQLFVQIAAPSGGDNAGGDDTAGDNSGENNPGGDTTDGDSSGYAEEAPSVTAPIELTAVSDGKGGAKIDISENVMDTAIRQAQREADGGANQGDGIAIQVNVAAGGQNFRSLTVNLPKVTQEKIINNRVETFALALESPEVTLKLNLEAVQEINRQANDDVQLTATRVTGSVNLSGEAKAAVGSRPVFQLTATSKNRAKSITDFGGGSVTVTIPYELQPGESAGGLHLVYINGQGKPQFLTLSSYDAENKLLRGATGHFSLYAVGYKAPDAFNDIADHWAAEDVEFAATRGLMEGVENGSFDPDGAVTRAVFITALGRLAGVDPASCHFSSYTDVPADADYAPYVAWAEKAGVLRGVGGVLFTPHRNVSRQEMAVIMQNYAIAMNDNVSPSREALVFADNASIASWAAGAVRAMQQAGVLMGRDGNQFAPLANATRGQAAAVLHRYVERVIDRQTAQGLDVNDSGSAMMYEDGKLVRSASRTVGTAAYSFDRLGEAALPAKKRRQYVVQRGDSFWRISKKLGCTMEELERLNGKSRHSMIHPGDVLLVPEG